MPHRIFTDRLVLRAFTAADADAVVAKLSDFEVSKWLGRVPHPYSLADFRIFGETVEARGTSSVAIEMSGVLVGGISINDHLGYWIARDQWGNGIATEAAQAMTRFHFETGAEDVLLSGYFEGNDGSARVLEKCGFRETGRRMNYSRSNGREMQHVDVALSRDDWERGQ